MTWLKKSDDFSDECASLSDAAYRTHDEALLWVMRREVGPRFPKRELRRFAETTNPDAAASELLSRGFWLDLGDTFEVVHHMEHQVEPEVIARRREMDAARQRKARMKKAGLTPPEPPSQRDNTRDNRDDNTRDPGLDGSGLGGTGNYALRNRTGETDSVDDARSNGHPIACDCGDCAWLDPRVGSWAGEPA